jgi:hypothetical protein
LSARDVVAGRPANTPFSFQASDYPTRQEVPRQVTDRGGTSHCGEIKSSSSLESEMELSMVRASMDHGQ